MANPEPFRLHQPPAELWGYNTVKRKLGANGWQMKAWLESGKFPRPVLRRRQRAYGEPAHIRRFSAEHCGRRLG
jgi:hypothetical protein